MEKQDIQLSDLPRILFGEVPGIFYVEVIFRIAIIYLVLMGSMRLMGKRMASQIGRNEMAAMVSLAAAIGVPLQDPSRGILPIFVIAFVVMLFQSVIAARAATDQRFERISQGNVELLITDGVLNLEGMKKSRLSRGRLFAQLRASQITHLGMVSRLFLEANGTFSLKPNPEPTAGLPVIPSWDKDFLATMETDSEQVACGHCGKVVAKKEQPLTCASCHRANEWSIAVK
ncbi:DUF421 domain-containing protein [Parapedobacter sp. ISTM3]|uniref:YetF C-terminal domain-containing protein n=1 Tax=Parapedobacter luteus TaxID=623280 RepID=A0A1T5DAB8_9SPHI|nr:MULTISPECIES: YetF domain-containing protein [Parapedobacter]MBK1438494.1 DUF421 domain-containing protein [Parapedobacter sp. ISTM3]SKB68599.1 Protein of unknown function [Parapedobacter luteus]